MVIFLVYLNISGYNFLTKEIYVKVLTSEGLSMFRLTLIFPDCGYLLTH